MIGRSANCRSACGCRGPREAVSGRWPGPPSGARSRAGHAGRRRAPGGGWRSGTGHRGRPARTLPSLRCDPVAIDRPSVPLQRGVDIVSTPGQNGVVILTSTPTDRPAASPIGQETHRPQAPTEAFGPHRHQPRPAWRSTQAALRGIRVSILIDLLHVLGHLRQAANVPQGAGLGDDPGLGCGAPGLNVAAQSSSVIRAPRCERRLLVKVGLLDQFR